MTFVNDYRLFPDLKPIACQQCGKPATTGQNNGSAPFWYRCKSVLYVFLLRHTRHSDTPIGETIDLTPVGCQTSAGNERVNRAMRVCDMTTVTVAELATQMVNTLESNQSYPSAEFDALKAAVTARQDAYENLLKAVSGR